MQTIRSCDHAIHRSIGLDHDIECAYHTLIWLVSICLVFALNP